MSSKLFQPLDPYLSERPVHHRYGQFRRRSLRKPGGTERHIRGWPSERRRCSSRSICSSFSIGASCAFIESTSTCISARRPRWMAFIRSAVRSNTARCLSDRCFSVRCTSSTYSSTSTASSPSVVGSSINASSSSRLSSRPSRRVRVRNALSDWLMAIRVRYVPGLASPRN